MTRDRKILIGLKSITGYYPVTPRTVFNLIKSEGFPATKIRGNWVSSVHGIDRWVEGKARGQDKKK
jgi:hypothetical protein